MMNQFIWAVILIVVAIGGMWLGSRYYYYSPFYPTVKRAVAVIHPTEGNTAAGTVVFIQQKDGIRVEANIHGLTPGEHGFHIHEFGDCACDDGTCAGGHFNPTHKPHGAPDSTERHVGDMGNVTANAQGIARYEYVDHVMALKGPSSIIGRAIIVHTKRDDLVSQPTGDAGARVGCGVIGVAKPD